MESLHLHTLLQKQFRIFILISFFVHIVVFLLLVLIPYQFKSKPVHIKEAIRVDMVGLPDLIQPQQKAVKKAKPKAKPVPPKKKPPQKKKKPQKEVPKKPQEKEIAKNPPVSAQQAQTKAIESLKAQTAQPQTYKGEQISKGESLEGEVDPLLGHGYYFTRMKAHIKMFWNLPRLLADKQLRATVVIEVNQDGNVMRIRLERSSGNETFDQIVVETIRLASPLPVPPPEILHILRQGVGFNFPE